MGKIFIGLNEEDIKTPLKPYKNSHKKKANMY